MRPILVNIPSKLLFVVALLAAAVIFARDMWLRRRDPARPLSSTPLYLLVGAELLIGFKSGSWTPSAAGFAQPWTPVPIYSYGVMLGTSLVAGWFLAMRFAKQDLIDQQQAGTIYMWTAVWSIIGSRVLWWLTTPEATVWDFPLINRGGMVAYGGMIGG
ncbi:MAG TPA: prolipoprotein diacylglyceryl transferase family protein, partial [Polyangia bacterium]|nr:prolipoprotein diacylglyceryl transferase family protein [Polyangia bacterium]